MAGPSRNKSKRAAGDKTAQPWFKKRRNKSRSKAKQVKASKRRNRK